MLETSPGILARTVLDLRATGDKFLIQTLLLAASWHRHATASSGLEVLTVGGENPALSSFLASIGASTRCIAASVNDDFSKHSNKIEAAYAEPGGRRILLLDNDVAFYGDVSELASLPANAICGSEAGVQRVHDAQWEVILKEAGLPLMRSVWSPIQGRSMENGPDATLGERWLYINSGVVLLAAGQDLRPTWLSAQRRIYETFRSRADASVAVTTSDQAGFAVAVAAHGEFEWLPSRFNYRWCHFLRGDEPVEQIRIVHFTGNIKVTGPGVADRMEAYWNKRILENIDRLATVISSKERKHRRDMAVAALMMTLDLIREYSLEEHLQACRQALIGESAT
jgi:hypothetical protein